MTDEELKNLTYEEMLELPFEELGVEIGGKKKSYNQIKDMNDSYVVADNTEVGMGNQIPLWIFGFMY